jgi:hypothetical protein
VNLDALDPDPAADHAGAGDEIVHPVEQRSKVDLPQPEGPMKAVTSWRWIFS